jgi:hypothetical protein
VIIIEIIEEFLLSVLLMIYVSGLAWGLSRIRQRLTSKPIDQYGMDSQSLATHEYRQEAEALSNLQIR